MLPMLDFTLYALLLVLSLAGIFLNIFSLPGNWLMLALATAYAAWFSFAKPPLLILAFLLILLLLAEVVETTGSLVGARKFGASKLASVSAILGTMVGALVGTFIGIPIPIPGAGTLIGAIGGAFLAAWIVELLRQRPLGEATKAAFGAALGRGVGLVAKISTGLLAWLILAFAAFPR